MGLYLIPMLMILGACSLQRVAIRTATPVFQKSADGMMLEKSWDFLRVSAPPNIKMMELLWLQDKENLQLLTSLIKSYAGYAFAVQETLAFAESLQSTRTFWKNSSIIFYTRTLDYGLLYLKEKGILREDLLNNDEEVLKKKIKRLDDEDISAVLYTAQAWGSLINLQKDNVALVSQIPKVKILFDYVCEKNPNIDHNVCDIFYAQYEASRPKMFGGNPEKGEQLFLTAIEKYPFNLLIRTSYLQYLVIPMMDEKKYEKIAAKFYEDLKLWDDYNRDNLEDNSNSAKYPELNLYNAIAKKRFEIIERNKKKIF